MVYKIIIDVVPRVGILMNGLILLGRNINKRSNCIRSVPNLFLSSYFRLDTPKLSYGTGSKTHFENATKIQKVGLSLEVCRLPLDVRG